MSELELRADLIERLQKIALREQRPVDAVLETMLDFWQRKHEHLD